MANEQTSVPLFVADTILTAAQQNISAGTGVPVFATTVTRDAAFGGANKALAEGQLCYLSSTNVVQYYDGAAWATVGPSTAAGLTLISTTTIGTTVSSVAVTGAFSATYANYKIVVNGGLSSATADLRMILGATTTGYYFGGVGNTFAGAATSDNLANGARWDIGSAMANGNSANIDILGPQLAQRTVYTSPVVRPSTTGRFITYGGFLDNATQYTDFTLNPDTGTLTGGTIRVYGYTNS